MELLLINNFTKEMPFFSVIIPTYNRADMLPRCIDSVLNQSFKDFELIIVDNYSEDNTAEIVQKYIEKDKRIFFVKEHNNGVIAHSRNVGIKRAKGDYICLLDSDDWFAINKLQKVYDVIKETGTPFIYHKVYEMSDQGPIGAHGRPLSWNNKFMQMLIGGNPICNSSVTIKRDILEDSGCFSEDYSLRTVEDMDCWLKILHERNDITYIDEKLGYYWIGDNISTDISTMQYSENLYKKYMPLVEPKMQFWVKRTLYYSNAIRFQRAGFFKEATYSYLKSLPMFTIQYNLKACFLFFYCCFKSILK